MSQKKKRRSTSANAFSPEIEEMLLAPIAKEMAGKPLSEGLTAGSPLKQLIGRIVEMALAEEMENHLGYPANERMRPEHDAAESRRDNTRNGYSPKTLKTSVGEVDIKVPRDRESTFEPQVVRRHQSISQEIEQRIISMYISGMTTRDIERHVEEMYGLDTSAMLVSRLSQKLDEELTQWRNRPLEPVYPVVFVDAMHMPVRHAQGVDSTAVYQVCTYNEHGKMEVIGIYMAKHESGRKESARYWHQIFVELEKRGLKDILILCADGLTGLEEAARAVYPQIHFQPCVLHMLRASTRIVGHKERSAVCKSIKDIYAAPSYEAAEVALAKLAEQWEARYPGIVSQWTQNLPRLANMWTYSAALRTMVYTTNAIENVNRQVRKVTKNRASMPNRESTIRLISLVLRDLNSREMNKKTPRNDWRKIVTELPIHFGDRLPPDWGHRVQAWT